LAVTGQVGQSEGRTKAYGILAFILQIMTFLLVVAYLVGIDIIDVSDEMIPLYIAAATALINLLLGCCTDS
jgi:hypothetical protein